MRYYWVVQELGGNSYFHGPYKTARARNSRYTKVRGGEVFKFNSRFEDIERAQQEFRDEEVKRLG